MALAGSRLSRIILLVRDVHRGVAFYRDGLSLPVISSDSSSARLSAGSGISLELTQAENEAQLSSGYGPFLHFEVNDMDSAVPKLLSSGGSLDGPVRYHAYGKVAAVRTPDGHMLALFEKADLPEDGAEALAAAAAAQARLQQETQEQPKPRRSKKKPNA